MKKFIKSARFTLGAVYFFMFALAVMTVALPWLVIWYVETMHRPQDLATVVMVTCYPCVPLAAIALVSARRLLKRIIAGTLFDDENSKEIRNIALCCFAAGVIMLVAGGFYMPFYIAGAAALTCTLALKVTMDLLIEAQSALKNKDTKEEESAEPAAEEK